MALLLTFKSVQLMGWKFKDGTLAYDDPFGYVAQIKDTRIQKVLLNLDG